MYTDGYREEITIELDTVTARRLSFLVETGVFSTIEDVAKYMIKNAAEYVFKNDGCDLY